jgi:hypothetical protein
MASIPFTFGQSFADVAKAALTDHMLGKSKYRVARTTTD